MTVGDATRLADDERTVHVCDGGVGIRGRHEMEATLAALKERS